MKTLAGSKRTAETPFASPTKAAASAKRSRTQYDYYDEDDSESLPEEQWSPDLDSGSEMSIDEDDERDSPSDQEIFMPRPRRPKFHQESRVKETADIQKEPIHRRSDLRYSYGRSSAKPKTKACVGCACSKSGKQCNASTCRCKGGTACKNPLRDLDLVTIFGQDPVALHPCFMTWIVRQTKANLERVNAQSLFDVLFEYTWMLDSQHSRLNEPYLEWKTKWNSLRASEASGGAGLVLKQELLRWGLTARDLQSIYFSFCHEDGWVQTEDKWHCRICGECMQATHYLQGGLSCMHFPEPKIAYVDAETWAWRKVRQLAHQGLLQQLPACDCAPEVNR